MRIDIWSDVVCPWCWIGKHRFQRGVELLGEDAPQLDVHWHPFLLDPEAGTTPVPLMEAYAAKFGGVERTQQMLAQTQSAAQAMGLPMDFSQGQVKVSTLPAHRLLWLAGQYAVQGGQPPEVFAQVLRKVAAEQAPAPAASQDEQACGPDGCSV